MRRYEAVVVGVSAGGLRVLSLLMPALPDGFALPMMVVQHRAHDTDDFLAKHLDKRSACSVKEAVLGEEIKSGTIYLAPAGQHLIITDNRTLALSTSPRIHHARPSIDSLFTSAADVYLSKLVGVLLTGANADGVDGLKTVQQKGGLTVVQEPNTAFADFLPNLAVESVAVDHVLPPEEIAHLLCNLASQGDA